jgi:hypothetical protein
MDVSLIRDIVARGLYRVTEDGQVISGLRSCPRLTPYRNKTTGYLSVSLRVDGKTIRETVHRLVAAIHCDGYQPKFVVNHKNGDRTDNRATNLEWISNDANLRHAQDVLGIRVPHLDQNGERNHAATLTEQDVISIKTLRAEGLLQREIALRFGVQQNTISRILSGKRWSHLMSTNAAWHSS